MRVRVTSFIAGLVWSAVVCTGGGLAQSSNAEANAAAVAAITKACGSPHAELSEGDKALAGRRYADAEKIFGDALIADRTSGIAMSGLVRTSLAEDKLPEALALAQRFWAQKPHDAHVLDALGEVRFRRGEVREAAIAFNESSQVNPCLGLTHYDAARFLNLSGMYASAQKELEKAHALAPEYPQITSRWRTTHAIPLTPEQTLARLQERLNSPGLADQQKEGIENAIKAVQTRQKGTCELVGPRREVKIPILPISAGTDPLASMYESEIEVRFNGKKKHLEIDTGASGMVLSRSVAKAAGLVPELNIKAGGIGDNGEVRAFVTHVDDIQIGGMEFRNCMVQVLEPGSVLERMPDVDGLIGTDVFRDYLVTLDFPGMELRLGALPARPGDPDQQVTSLNTDNAEITLASAADTVKDRFVAPEMKDWTPIFRSGHDIILPTLIGDTPGKLFLLDSGASHGMISPEAAREVTDMTSFNTSKVEGISGQVQNMLRAYQVTVTFAGVRQLIRGLDSFDTKNISRAAGVEISGIIGFPTLRELVLTIDYRDNLIHVVYDPKKGYHPRY